MCVYCVVDDDCHGKPNKIVTGSNNKKEMCLLQRFGCFTIPSYGRKQPSRYRYHRRLKLHVLLSTSQNNFSPCSVGKDFAKKRQHVTFNMQLQKWWVDYGWVDLGILLGMLGVRIIYPNMIPMYGIGITYILETFQLSQLSPGSEGETLRPVDGRVLQPGCFYEDPEPSRSVWPAAGRKAPESEDVGGWAILVVKNGDFVGDFARIWGLFFWGFTMGFTNYHQPLHEKIKPNIWQVSLGDAEGFSPIFFWLFLSDYYGKPRALPTPVGSPSGVVGVFQSLAFSQLRGGFKLFGALRSLVPKPRRGPWKNISDFFSTDQ